MWTSPTAIPLRPEGRIEIGREGESRRSRFRPRDKGVCTDFGDEAGILRD
jgi:hypothetical protein